MYVHKVILIFLVVLGVATVIYLAVFGYEYFSLPLTERPHSELHDLLKPSGEWGHAFGIFGSTMMLLLFLYSVRKRVRWFSTIGMLSTWLKYHMFLGVMGPVLVIFHTSFKFRGIVAVSFWTMVLVMLSGFLGRYLYAKIPRTISGHELSLQEMEEQNHELRRRLREEYSVPPNLLERIEQFGRKSSLNGSDLSALLHLTWADIVRPFKLRSVFGALHHEREIRKADFRALKHITKQKVTISRKLAALEVTHRFFHYWHVFHKPFAFVMIFIMIIHITVVMLFGYRWIF